MANEKQLDKIKKEAAAKAKAAALAKLNREPEQRKTGLETANSPTIKVSLKAKTPRKENTVRAVDEVEKTKEIAKVNVTKTAKPKQVLQQERNLDPMETVDNEKANEIAIAKTKAVSAGRANGVIPSGLNSNNIGASDLKPEKPSVNQPLLNLIKKELTIKLGSNIIEESYINKQSKDIPTLIISKNNFYKVAKALKEIKTLDFDYFNLLHGTDFQTHMEVYTQLRSYKNGYDVALKTKLEREYPEVDSLTSLWVGANWPESETYDLLGIKFIDNYDLHRIFLGENWVGYPLRKDYIPFDEEVGAE